MKRRDFLSAAIFGAVAGVAVCKGKAIAGDSASVPFHYSGEYTSMEFSTIDRLNKSIEALNSAQTQRLKRAMGDSA